MRISKSHGPNPDMIDAGAEIVNSQLAVPQGFCFAGFIVTPSGTRAAGLPPTGVPPLARPGCDVSMKESRRASVQAKHGDNLHRGRFTRNSRAIGGRYALSGCQNALLGGAVKRAFRSRILPEAAKYKTPQAGPLRACIRPVRRPGPAPAARGSLPRCETLPFPRPAGIPGHTRRHGCRHCFSLAL